MLIWNRDFSSGRTHLYITLSWGQFATSFNTDYYKFFSLHNGLEASWNVMAHSQKSEIVFRRNGRVHLTTGSRGVRISGSNARCTMFWGSVKDTGYSLLSPVSPSLLLPCVTVCHHISTGVYQIWTALNAWHYRLSIDIPVIFLVWRTWEPKTKCFLNPVWAATGTTCPVIKQVSKCPHFVLWPTVQMFAIGISATKANTNPQLGAVMLHLLTN